jgi:hypothetical protein
MANTAIRSITTDELKRLRNTEGLVLQGCGGDAQEWADGINELLTDEGILRDGAKFTDVSSFENNGITNLLFSMDGVELDVGKLAMWRLKTRGELGGTWLSDYMVNKFGINMDDPAPLEQERAKPEAALIGADGNVFNLLGIASNALKRAGLREEAAEMRSRVMDSGSYENALAIMTEYVEPIGVDEYQEHGGMKMSM